ncbi:MAG: hypothetical protein N3B11_07580 [Coriobacteriia bacterium]|nr:hypothetical protein [Coriobacteriia bacterium]
MGGCWSARGCDDELQSRCAHASVATEKCPAECYYAKCPLPQHRVTSDPAMIFDPEVDRAAAMKDVCLSCEFFLRRGPRLSRLSKDA